jgi:hypothetical protein
LRLPHVWELVWGQALSWKWRTSSSVSVGRSVWMHLFKVPLYQLIVVPFSKKSGSKIPSSSQNKDAVVLLTEGFHLNILLHGDIS